ncbi:hypothetical protein OGAPHI_001572 [Ogataea philodendri]|uniref:Uncharacterized protein n=1 Tax=Ogataea philodendri TaxID=1378263 RepID=A0A9P8T827_9ASCO|nr:uncharacterized protein OGAPHI_001572 [Ogataea philodendri]KAH3669451.1 hypothetical protein OGAPHI_001572 [Ogataea philodendri]
MVAAFWNTYCSVGLVAVFSKSLQNWSTVGFVVVRRNSSTILEAVRLLPLRKTSFADDSMKQDSRLVLIGDSEMPYLRSSSFKDTCLDHTSLKTDSLNKPSMVVVFWASSGALITDPAGDDDCEEAS